MDTYMNETYGTEFLLDLIKNKEEVLPKYEHDPVASEYWNTRYEQQSQPIIQPTNTIVLPLPPVGIASLNE